MMTCLSYKAIAKIISNLIAIFCCHQPVHETTITPGEIGELVTAFFTFALAVTTVLLYIEAKRQLRKIKEFIDKYTTAAVRNELLLRVQSAENIIFKQIDFHYKILERIEVNEKDFFKKMYEKLREHYGIPPAPDVQSKISEAYGKLDFDFGYQLRHYFRNLYRTFKYIKDIDNTKIVGFDKKYYAKLVRAQLSEYEILLLFYNCIWVGDKNKFKDLVVEYGLLEGINYDRLFEREEHYKLYADGAYGDDLD